MVTCHHLSRLTIGCDARRCFMAYQMTITLTDQEYAQLIEAAARSGKPLETLVHEALAPKLDEAQVHDTMMSNQEFNEYLLHKGTILNIATKPPLTPEEIALKEELAQAFAGGKSAAEMVIEDRGPY